MIKVLVKGLRLFDCFVFFVGVQDTKQTDGKAGDSIFEYTDDIL